MSDPLLSKQVNELRLTDEWRELHAEGRRRMREHEQIETETLTLPSGRVITRRVGKHTLPPAPEVDHLWSGVEEFNLYTPSNKDRAGLEQELMDLDRDCESMRHHERVKYE